MVRPEGRPLSRRVREHDARSLSRAVFGGNEPPVGNGPRLSPEEVAAWVDAYAEATGRASGLPASRHGMEWPGWLDRAVAVRAALAGRGVRVGYIYMAARSRIKRAGRGSRRAAFLLESRMRLCRPMTRVIPAWFDQPDRTLPDNDPSSFTGLVNRYFRPHSTIELRWRAAGVVRQRQGPPIAGVPVRASCRRTLASQTGRVAADGCRPTRARRSRSSASNGEGAAAAAESTAHRIGQLCRGRQEPRAEPESSSEGVTGADMAGARRASTERLGHAVAEGQKGSGASRQFRALQGDARRSLCLRGGREVPAGQSGAVFAGVVFLDKAEVAREGLSLSELGRSICPRRSRRRTDRYQYSTGPCCARIGPRDGHGRRTGVLAELRRSRCRARLAGRGFVTRLSVRLMRPPAGNQSRSSVEVPG